MTQNLETVKKVLANYSTENGSRFNVTMIDNDEFFMLSIVYEDIEEFAILATLSASQLLFNVALFDQSQIIAGQENTLNKMMLELNIAMPLSSFALTAGIYSIFGAMSIHSEDSQVQEEVTVLAENIIDALEVCQQFLIKA